MADFLPEHELLAAIDLGSNSFHLAIAKIENGQARKIASLSEKVQLGAGLDEHNNLTEEAQQRGLDCLSRFVARIGAVKPCYIRIVATNALRQANNAAEFVQRASAILPKPIEIIAGREEARLIYMGVTQAVGCDESRRLVVDIGGGSTEFIIGRSAAPIHTESLQMGCVSYTQKFFADGHITVAAFDRAVAAAKKQIKVLVHPYKATGWDQVVGSSGTIKACCQVMGSFALTDAHGHITRHGLYALKQDLLLLKHVDHIDFKELKQDRRALLPAGLAILLGVFEALELQSMAYSDGALREGVMYDLVGRFRKQDSRDHSVQLLMTRYHVDEAHALRVATTAKQLFDQVATALQLGKDDDDLLRRAACLHEVGLTISHSGYHRHGAYILQHSDIAGFSHNDQTRLAMLIGQHRRKLKPELKQNILGIGGLPLLYDCLLLRMSVLLHRDRSEQVLHKVTLEITGKDVWQLSIGDNKPSTDRQANFSLLADVQEEQQQFEHWGIQLHVFGNDNPRGELNHES